MPKKLSNALHPLAVKNAKAGSHVDGGGVRFLVKEIVAKSWVYRFMLNGRTRDIGLGPAAGVDAIALSAARDLASALRLKVKAGIDPLEERQREAAEALAAAQAAQVAGVTFKTVAETYIATHEGSWKAEERPVGKEWVST